MTVQLSQRKRSISEITEETLMRRLERRYDEQRISEDLAGFFELRGEEARGATPLEIAALHNNLRELGRRGDPLGGTAAPGSPLTSRGGTFNSDEPIRILGGYDWCEFGVSGHWAEGRFDRIKTLLKEAKEQASAGNIEGGIVELEGREWIVNPKSAVGGLVYSYVLSSGGVVLLIHGSPEKVPQPIRVRYTGLCLSGNDLFAVHAEEAEYLRSLGFIETEHKISRVDYQVMVPIDVGEFINLIESGCAVCKATGEVEKHGRFTTGTRSMSVGTDTQLALYDKAAELNRMMVHDPVKYHVMMEYVLGEDYIHDDAPLTRVEYRLRRPALADLEIDTFDDLLACERALVRMLTHRWFRLLGEPKKRGHSSLQETAECWKTVQQCFERWFPGADDNRSVKYERNRTVKCEPEHLIKQAVGCLATAAALTVGMHHNTREAVAYAIGKVEEYAVKLTQRSAERAAEFCVQVGNVCEDMAALRNEIKDMGRRFFDKRIAGGPPDDF